MNSLLSDQVYVIVENLHNAFDDNDEKYRIVSVVKTYNLATQYLSPNRKIKGPFPLITNDLPIKPYEFITAPPKIFDINQRAKPFNLFEPRDPRYFNNEPVVKLFEPTPFVPPKSFNFNNEPVVKLFESTSVVPPTTNFSQFSGIKYNSSFLDLSSTDLQLMDLSE